MDDRSKMSSLYGPGAVSCWLCTIFSVLVSWFADNETGGTDSITNDFIAVLTLPTVASIHYFRLVAIEWGRNDAASLAPLRICKAFCGFGTILISRALRKGKYQRLVPIIIICWLCQIALWLSPGNLDAYDACHKISYVHISIVLFCAMIRIPVIKRYLDSCCLDLNTPLKRIQAIIWFKKESETFELFPIVYQAAGFTLLPLLPSWMDANFTDPERPYKITELDQAVALGAGIVTLGFSIRDALRYGGERHDNGSEGTESRGNVAPLESIAT